MKEKIISLLPIVLLSITCLLFVSGTYFSYVKLDAMASAMIENEPVVILIDPGHGGEDGGAQSNSGLLEKDINLSISLYLKDIFRESGYPVIMTREDDIAIGDPSLKTVRERKVSDIHKRLEIAENQKNCILISIHQNFFSDPQYYGTQVFYGKNLETSQFLAEKIQNSVVYSLQPKNTRQCKETTDSIYLLWNTTLPAVLVECGFLSNPEEAILLSQEEYQKQMAFCIYRGVIEHLCDSNC